MDLTLFEWDEHIADEWDEFVLRSPYGSIHQMSVWKAFQEKIPGREEVREWGVRNRSGKIVAVTLCVKMSTGFLGKYWWYSPRGPVFDIEKESGAGEFLITKAKQRLQNTDGFFWRMDPYFPKKYKIQNTKYETATQNYQPTDTLEIDLTKSDEQILSEMKRKGRYNINLARKKGVQIIAIKDGDSSEKDLDDFWRLNTQTTNRDRFSGHEKSYYVTLLEELKEYAVLFFAEYEGERIATAISTFCGEKAIYYFGASTSDPEYRNLMAPYLLQWKMMQYGKSKHCKTYDFLGIAPEGETNHVYAGISEFKWKFGGERKIYAPAREIVLNSFWYTLYRTLKFLRK